jgi:PAS domain S-box-containing protein
MARTGDDRMSASRSRRLQQDFVRMFKPLQSGACNVPPILGYAVAVAAVTTVIWLIATTWHAPVAIALFLVAVLVGGWLGGRKTIESALRRTKANLQLILETSPLPIAGVDAEGRITSWNKAAEQVFGWTAAEVIGRRCRTVPPDQIEDYVQLIHRAMQGETVTGLVRQRLKNGGKLIYSSVSLAPQRNEGGEPIGVTVIIEDITQRKLAEETLRESRELLHLVLATLPVGVVVMDRNGDIILANAASNRIWGGAPAVSGSKRWSDLKGYWHDSGEKVDPSDWASVRALSEGKTSLDELIDIETFGGERKTIRNSAAPIRNAEAMIMGAVIVNDDVTERVRAEDAVRKNEQRLRDVIDTIPVIAFINMPDGSNEFTNRSWQQYTGLSVEETAGWGWKSTVHPDDIALHLEKWRAAVSAGGKFDSAARYRGANGGYRWFLVRAVPLRDERGNVLRWYGVLMDIEDRMRAERSLRESAARLQHLSRRLLTVQEEERRHLARELHDEFGQLLATITLQLHAAKTVAGAAARSTLEECMSILQRAGDEVRSLALELRPTVLDTAGLDATLRWLASQHEQRTGTTTEVIGHLNDVPGDVAIAAFRVVQEALTNVLRHARARRIWIELNQTDAGVEIAVGDDGVGFDVAETVERTSGLGHLGLLGMKERIEILGGNLKIDSRPGRGTHVRIWLPSKDAGASRPRDLTT